jgi:hypothetical protein
VFDVDYLSRLAYIELDHRSVPASIRNFWVQLLLNDDAVSFNITFVDEN